MTLANPNTSDTQVPAAATPPAADPRSESRSQLARAAWALIPLAAIVYLGLEGGGFDPIVYGRVGIGIWWLVLLAALVGAAGVGRIPRRGLIVAGLLAALAAWTGLSTIWSESADRSAQELARASTYLAALFGALLLRSRIGGRLMLGSVAAGIAVIIAVALLNRMQPLWFPKNETLDLVFAAEARLNYPLNYWNGLAGLIAVGTPLLALFAAEARLLAMRALAVAALPAAGLAVYLTLSRGGALALALALAVFVALTPRRGRAAGALAVGAIGTAILIWAIEARPELADGLRAGIALDQGDEMLAITVGVCLLAGLVPLIGSRLAGRIRLPSLPRFGALPRPALIAGALAAVVVVALVADLPARADNAWEEFKDPGVERGSERLESASGNGRYQWWGSALDANASAPVLGIGAGTFEFWWLRNGSIPSRVVDAHSLYLESLGELGLIGGALVIAFVGATLYLIVRRLTIR